MIKLYEALQETVAAIRSRSPLQPKVGIILGSGLGGFADAGGNVSADPRLDAGAHLRAGSAAIDTGDDAVPTSRSTTLDLDRDARRLEPRPPAVEFGRACREGDVPRTPGTGRAPVAGGRTVSAGLKTRSMASRKPKKTCRSPARLRFASPSTPP